MNIVTLDTCRKRGQRTTGSSAPIIQHHYTIVNGIAIPGQAYTEKENRTKKRKGCHVISCASRPPKRCKSVTATTLYTSLETRPPPTASWSQRTHAMASCNNKDQIMVPTAPLVIPNTGPIVSALPPPPPLSTVIKPTAPTAPTAPIKRMVLDQQDQQDQQRKAFEEKNQVALAAWCDSDSDTDADDEEKAKEKEYEVARICNVKNEQGQVYYLVEWVGYKEKTWEPYENVINCTESLEEFKSLRASATNSSSAVVPKLATVDSWTCRSCTFINVHPTLECEMCGSC